MDKAAWRRWARDGRSGPVDGAVVVAGLVPLLRTVAPRWVVTYRALPHEVDLAALEAHPEVGPLALTRTPARGRDLSLHVLSEDLERHRWGFDQPGADAVPVAEVDVGAVLVPGLAFDRRGHRLGHGLGYYDRFLARLPAGALRIGVIASDRVVEALPADPHDVAMTHLATELGVRPCPPG